MQYPVKITALTSGKFEATCRFIPECVYECDTEKEALDYAAQAVPGTLELFYRRKRKPIPLPDGTLEDNETPIYVPIKVQSKIVLWNTLIAKYLRVADLAKALGVSAPQAQRYVDLSKDGASIEAIENAFYKLGMHFDLSGTEQAK